MAAELAARGAPQARPNARQPRWTQSARHRTGFRQNTCTPLGLRHPPLRLGSWGCAPGAAGIEALRLAQIASRHGQVIHAVRFDTEKHVYYSGQMDMNRALAMFDALSQETRLRAFRLLVQAGPDGMAAGALSDGLGTPHNTMSFHLSHLANAGVVSSRKRGRSVIYSANFDATRDLIAFLVKDCCSADVASIREDQRTGCAVIELAAWCGN